MRRDDWLLRLDALLGRLDSRPFVWGYNDCCTLAADAVEAVTGHNPLPHLRGSYETRHGALRWLAREGFTGLPDALERFAGRPREHALMAQRGDVVLLGEFAVGVVDGAGRIAHFSPDHAGLMRAQIGEAKRAWGA